MFGWKPYEAEYDVDEGEYEKDDDDDDDGTDEYAISPICCILGSSCMFMRDKTPY